MYEQRTTLVDGEVVAANLPLAEQLDPAEVVRLQYVPHSRGQKAREYQSAWASLELALTAMTTKKKSRSFLKARERFRAIQADAGYYALRAAEVLDYLPLYVSRMRYEPYDLELIADLSLKIGHRAVAAAQQDLVGGQFYESIFKCLSVGQGDPRYVTFPASPREEESSQTTENYNHDVYAIRGHKVPIQLKPARRRSGNGGYASAVKMVYVRSLIYQAAYGAYGPDAWGFNRSDGGTTKNLRLNRANQKLLFVHAADVVEADMHGAQLSSQEGVFVTELKSRVAAAIDNVAPLPQLEPVIFNGLYSA